MGEGLYERLVREEGYHCRTYAPVGGHRELLAGRRALGVGPVPFEEQAAERERAVGLGEIRMLGSDARE